MVVDVYNVQLPQNAVDDNDVPRAGTAQGSEVSDFQQLLGLGQVHAQNAGNPQEHIPLRADLGVQDPVKGGLVQSRKPRDGLDGTGRFTQKLEKVVAKGGAVGFVKELRDGCSAFQTGNGNFGGT